MNFDIHLYNLRMTDTYETTCIVDDMTFEVLAYHLANNTWIDLSVYVKVPFGGLIEYVKRRRASLCGNLLNAIRENHISLKFVDYHNEELTEEELNDRGGNLLMTYTFNDVCESITLVPNYDNTGKHISEYREYLTQLKELTALRVEVAQLKAENATLKALNATITANKAL